MSQPNQGNNSDAQPAIPVKRKRGRPRKDQSLNRAENTRMPPGFEGMNGNQPRQVDPLDNATDGMVGQVVTGVVEAAFDAGYLLTVRIGNSNTSMRGVVFKPGHYVPVTAENDVAPQVQMIRRNDIHLPTKNQTRVRGHNPRSTERNEQHVSYLGNDNQAHGLVPQTSNLTASKAKYVSSAKAPSDPPTGARGNEVPVVLQPVIVSNGLQPANQVPLSASQADPTAAFKGKHVETVIPLAVCQSSAEDSGSAPEQDIGDMNEPLFIEPLQAIHLSVSKPLENSRTGRMTELLQAVQEKMTENQLPQVELLAVGSKAEFHGAKSPRTDVGDEETVQSLKHSWASSV